MDHMSDPAPEPTSDQEVHEPEHGAVDDWFGQRVDRDKELAEKLARETEDDDEASDRFEAEKEGHRPEDLPTEQRP